MKKFLHSTLSSLAVVIIWYLLLNFFVTWWVNRTPINPSFPYYSSLLSYAPKQLSVWAHFDGAHYLKLATAGYVDQGTQAFFPLYPLLIRALAWLGLSPFYAGLLISLAALTLSFTLMRYLFPNLSLLKSATILILPTSFFFGSLYTESFFLFETLLFFLALQRKQFLLAAVVAGFASSTRFAGSILVVCLLVAIYPSLKTNQYRLLLFPLSLLGLLFYIYFLFVRFGDPLAFIHVQTMFGVGRSGDEVILLPQVIFRYLKIFVTVPFNSLICLRAVFEFVSFFVMLIYVCRQFRSLSHPLFAYLMLSLLLPTLSGTFASIPRYLLVLVPLLYGSLRLNRLTITLFALSLPLMLLLLSLFASGQFVA